VQVRDIQDNIEVDNGCNKLWEIVKNMRKLDYLKIIGILCILMGLILNPSIIGKTLSPDGVLDEGNKVTVLFYKLGLILLGIGIFYAKKINPNIFLLVGSIIFILIIFEITLHVNPLILGDDFANTVKSRYKTGYGGIYEYDSKVSMLFMKPNFRTEAYFNRYTWLHETDSLGFRNPRDILDPDIILLGDSFIYGHGLNQNQTVGYFLEEITNYSTMNMARQADSSFQQAYILNTYALKYKPKYIIYFFFSNDIDGLRDFLKKEDMIAFIQTPVEDITFKERSKENFLPTTVVKRFIGDLSYDPYFLIAYKQFKHNIEIKLTKTKDKSINQNQLMNKNISIIENSLEWDYTKHAILQMNHISKNNGMKFVIAPITKRKLKYQRKILENFSIEHNISFVDTDSLYGVEEFYLPRDGHFSEKGAKEMANLVATFIKNVKE